jgi:hypothetical protein
MRGFVADRYFTRRRGERPFADLLGSLYSRGRTEFIPITIESLVKSVETKRWTDSDPSESAPNTA